MGVMEAVSLVSSRNLENISNELLKWHKKLETEELYIVFSGHFSAGKSTLINELLGTKLLPSSPIPTTANVVEIRQGNPRGIALKEDEPPIEFSIKDDLTALRDYCIKQAVTKIELYYPSDNLAKQTVIVDTPGIDSADDVHQMQANSILFLADIVFYVMDYNHVQSEINLSFIKELTVRGKTVYLIVNQIDKHLEFELDFPSYQSSIEQTLLDWGIVCDRIFYTSLIEPEHEFNQFSELNDFLKSFSADKKMLIEEAWQSEIQYLIRRINEQLSEFGDVKHDFSMLETNKEQFEILKQAFLREQQEYLKTWESFEQKISSSIRDARLFSFATTESLADFLESLSSQFKIGWFASHKKIMQERHNREQIFLTSLQEQVDSQLVWILRSILQKGLEELHIMDENAYQKVANFSLPLGMDFTSKMIKPGASGREYVYRCRDEMTSAVQLMAQQEVQIILETAKNLYRTQVETLLNDTKYKMKELETVIKKEEDQLEKSIENSRFVEQIKTFLGGI